MRETAGDSARRLKKQIDAAWARFNTLPGVLSGVSLTERAWRLQALDAVIADLTAAEERRRLYADRPPTDRRAYAELLRQLRQASVAGDEPRVDAFTHLRPGDSARVELHVEHATPQALAALAGLVRTLPPGTVRVEVLRDPDPGRGPVAMPRGA